MIPDDIERELRAVPSIRACDCLHVHATSCYGPDYPALAARVREWLEARHPPVKDGLVRYECAWHQEQQKTLVAWQSLQAQLDARPILGLDISANDLQQEIERLEGALDKATRNLKEAAELMLDIDDQQATLDIAAEIRSEFLAPPPAAPEEAQG